jgi:cell wall-associated NlpC family hydrolase
MNEAELRAKVIAEAYSWIDTPFAHNAKVKGAGVDCAMLLEAVFMSVGLICEAYPKRYSSQWHLHRDEERYLAWLNYLALEVPQPQPGDVGIWQIGRCYSHAGLFVDADHVIHAWADSGKVARMPVRMGRLSTMPGPKGPVPRPVKYFDIFAKQRAL